MRALRSLTVLLVVIPTLSLMGCAAWRQPASPPQEAGSPGSVSAFAAAGDEALAAEPGPDGATATLVAETLETSEAARVYWEQGDIDAALAALDLSYELLLQIPDDPATIQQKDDLRQLISRRITDIYRSRSTTASDLDSPIPVELTPEVEHEIKRFQGPERRFFLESYQRSGQHRPMIVRMLREAGLPEELSWLPLVESGFKTRALSSARALGLWQFISSTGSRYGLARSRWIDERMDPEKSTGAAIRYLTDLHGMFGDWLTVLAGYNCGEHRVMSEIRRQQNGYLDRFWDLFGSLPRETARYVPRFVATLLIVGDPEKYGFELPDPLQPIAYEELAVGRHVRLTDLDRALSLEPKTLDRLNPELRQGVTPAEAYDLKVPRAAAPSFEVALAGVAPYVPAPEQTYAYHRVRRGETLSRIALRHGSSVNAIARANHLKSRNRIRVGQRLKIPQRGGVAVASATGPAKEFRYKVRRGDSLWKLASRYGTTVERIKSDNGLRGDRLSVGQRLTIRTGRPASGRSYTVRSRDTIGQIARAQKVSIDAILRANSLSRRSVIYPGQVLRIPD